MLFARIPLLVAVCSCHHLPCLGDITPSSPPTKTQDKADSLPHPSNADHNGADDNDAGNNEIEDDNADDNNAAADINTATQTTDNDADNAAMQMTDDDADDAVAMQMTDGNADDNTVT
jgi:hypothetical protein